MKLCEQCHKPIARNNSNLFGLVLRGNKLLKVCHKCYKDIYTAEINKLEITNNEMAVSGLLELGYNKSDVKELLKRWAKNQIEKI